MGSSKARHVDVGLSARALSKRYGGAQGFEALRGADLDIGAGDFVSIVGRSGSGKSTLLALLGALTRPTNGKLLFDGADVWSLSEEDRAAYRCRTIGFVFQFPSLLANLSALDNVVVPALLGRSMDPERAYMRAYELIAEVGLAERAEAFPGTLSGGEQRRLVIARALINAPSFVLADEPTSDLDEESEADVIGLLEDLQRRWSFGLVLVTHDLALARRAQRVYEMRQGRLVPADNVPVAPLETIERTHSHAPVEPVPARQRKTTPVRDRSRRLGASFWRLARSFVVAAIVVVACVLVVNDVVRRYQDSEVREREARLARLADMALSRLQAEVESVEDLGEGHYELAVVLRNIDTEKPIYVLSPDMHAFVQVGRLWQEIPLRPLDENERSVLRIADRHVYHYAFEARVEGFAELLPNYMHMRFSSTMLVSPSPVPKDDIFERKDNYYVYLKPFDVSDETITRHMKFSGKPPLWIPMPPH